MTAVCTVVISRERSSASRSARSRSPWAGLMALTVARYPDPSTISQKSSGCSRWCWPAAASTAAGQRRGTVVVVDRFIRGIGVDLAGAVAVDLCPDVAEQSGQLRFVVVAHAFARGAPLSLGGHDRDGTVRPDRAAGREMKASGRRALGE